MVPRICHYLMLPRSLALAMTLRALRFVRCDRNRGDDVVRVAAIADDANVVNALVVRAARAVDDDIVLFEKKTN